MRLLWHDYNRTWSNKQFFPELGSSTDRFLVNSARLYLSGPVTDKIKFMFNTEYDGASNKIGVLDAAARIEVKPQFNIWMGRFLPPSDRANVWAWSSVRG